MDANPMSAVWPSHVFQDYHGAAVTLVTATYAKRRHLLFALIELCPKGIPLPPEDVEQLKRNFGDVTIFVSVNAVSVDQALTLYQSILSGQLTVPNKPECSIDTLKLVPEPAMGHFLISTDAPIAAAWHACPRIHRLVRLEEVPEAVVKLEKMGNYNEIREWLAGTLNFDLLVFDDFLCCAALIAPNPVARGIHTYWKETLPDGRERLRVKAFLREGYSSETLNVRLREKRPSGVAFSDIRLDKHGMADITLPQRSEQSGLEVFCDTRGALCTEKPGFFFREVSTTFTSHTILEQGAIRIPPRKKGGNETSRHLFNLQPAQKNIQPLPTDLRGPARLATLQARREARTGKLRPDGFLLPDEDDQRLFISDRSEAIEFIQQLVRRATRQIIFVDPYFSYVDVCEFALGYQYQDTSVSILTSTDFLGKDEKPEQFIENGDRLLVDLANLEAELKTLDRKLPDFKLMADATKIFHDRFLVIDNSVWHFGHSFNQIGDGHVSLVTKLPHPFEMEKLIVDGVAKAESFSSAWPKRRRQAVRASKQRKKDSLEDYVF